MSLTRTGHGPLDWRDDGPSVASSRRPTYATRNAEPVGSMVPTVSYSSRATDTRREQNREAAQRHREAHP
jgi:hypothetical protein